MHIDRKNITGQTNIHFMLPAWPRCNMPNSPCTPPPGIGIVAPSCQMSKNGSEQEKVQIKET
jgi:hypothetical protein